jgi:hypothetical protein
MGIYFIFTYIHLYFFFYFFKRFVGGGYGKCNEREMMLEIMTNGPIVASINPGFMFMYYIKGVYHTLDAAEWILNSLIYNKYTYIYKNYNKKYINRRKSTRMERC